MTFPARPETVPPTVKLLEPTPPPLPPSPPPPPPHDVTAQDVETSTSARIGSDRPAKSAEVLAETLGAQIAVIDPLGGQGDRTTYADLLRYNATRVREALQ